MAFTLLSQLKSFVQSSPMSHLDPYGANAPVFESYLDEARRKAKLAATAQKHCSPATEECRSSPRSDVDSAMSESSEGSSDSGGCTGSSGSSAVSRASSKQSSDPMSYLNPYSPSAPVFESYIAQARREARHARQARHVSL